jgi:MFS family permease
MKPLIKSDTFRAFRHRNYALFFAGQSVSQIGTWMQRTAITWVIYSLTHSAFMLGFAVFAQQFPSFLLSLPGGVVSDRYSRYKILLFTQTASMIQAILLAILILTKHYVIWEILALGALLGVVNAFDVPARQPMVHEMIPDKDDIPNAFALNSGMVNIARLIGPALSGIVLQFWGAGVCFSLNALSFIAVIGSLLLMKLPPFVQPTVKKKVLQELKEGVRYVVNTPAIGTIILLLILLGVFIFPYDTIIPVFAKVVFKGNAATYGYISSLMGLGAIGGSLYFASLKRDANIRRVVLLSIAILGIGFIIFSFINYFPLAIPVAIIIGFGSLMPMSASITIMQLESAPNMRGRVMSFMAMSFFGMLPLGSLLIGSISQKIGAPMTMFCQGIAALVIVGVFYKFMVKKPEVKVEAVTVS